MADNRKSYNAVIREFNRKHGLTQAQARVAWRTLRDRLEKTPRVGDLKTHPRITAQVVKKAPAQERGLRAARTRSERKQAPSLQAPPGKRATVTGDAGTGQRYVIGAERMRELEIEWDAFDADTGWDDPDPYGETA